MTGCETLRGVDSLSVPIQKVSDASCVEKAIKKVSTVGFLNREKWLEDTKTVWGEAIHREILQFHYVILSLKELNAKSTVALSEETSPNPRYNQFLYTNSFGKTNGPPFTAEQLKAAENAILAVNASVRKECGLKIEDKIKVYR